MGSHVVFVPSAQLQTRKLRLKFGKRNTSETSTVTVIERT